MKTVQYFSKEYLEQCRKMKPREILRFFFFFRKLHTKPSKSKLISLKVDERLLEVFRKKAELHNVKYQTMIKKLMQDWVDKQK
ncbi:MAG: hypothetical protein KDD59_05165 [Bdellovibrionales bacterium]|nr:hypothetical protein [Bdellovibrionales bacterium]